MIDKEKLNQLLANTGDMALKRRARRILEELSPKKGEKILDVGCGDGFYLHFLSNLGEFKLVGLDNNPLALVSAKKNLKGKKIKLVEGDIFKMPFADNNFDKIICSEVLEHLKDDLAGLKELKRVLKPRGILMVSAPNHNYPFFWDPVNWILERIFKTHIKSGFWAGIWNQHLRLYKPLEIKNVVEKAGFRVEKLESLTFWCLPFNHNLLHLAARVLYGGKLSGQLASVVSKYETKTKRPFLVSFAFWVVNTIDKLNDIWIPKNRGVGVFVKAYK